MNDFERMLWVFAEEMETNVVSCFMKASDAVEWVDSDEEAASLMRRFRGIFIASLVGEIEEKICRSFSSVFDQLSDSPTGKKSKYWFSDMPKRSSLRGRAKVMWAIRIAYTHGNGSIHQIDDEKVAEYLQPRFARTHFRGVRVESDVVKLFADVTGPALKTTLEICDRFTPVASAPQLANTGPPLANEQ